MAALGIPRRTYYRWLKEEAWARSVPAQAVRPVQPYEALPEERAAVLDYTRHHRRETNLQLKQGTLPLTEGETVASS